MQEAARELRSEWVRRNDMPIEIRIGINTGEVIVGNMGSKQLRLSYTALGSNVNLAQRLETEAPVGGILISERTNELVQDRVETVSIGPIRVKGLDAPVPVYEVHLDSRRPEKDRGSSLTEKAARDDRPS